MKSRREGEGMGVRKGGGAMEGGAAPKVSACQLTPDVVRCAACIGSVSNMLKCQLKHDQRYN